MIALPRFGLGLRCVIAIGMLVGFSLVLLSPSRSEAKPKIGKQVTLKSRISPISMPQLHIGRGERLPKRFRIVMRVITMGGKRKVATHLTAPRGYRMRLLPDGGNYRAWGTEPLGKYRGHKRVRFLAVSHFSEMPRFGGRVYAVVKRVRRAAQ